MLFGQLLHQIHATGPPDWTMVAEDKQTATIMRRHHFNSGECSNNSKNCVLHYNQDRNITTISAKSDEAFACWKVTFTD